MNGDVLYLIAGAVVYDLAAPDMIADVTPIKLYSMLHDGETAAYDKREMQFGVTSTNPEKFDAMITALEQDAKTIGYSELHCDNWTTRVTYIGIRAIDHERQGVIRASLGFATNTAAWSTHTDFASPAASTVFGAEYPVRFALTLDSVPSHATVSIVVTNTDTLAATEVLRLRGQCQSSGALVFDAQNMRITIGGDNIIRMMSEADFDFMSFPAVEDPDGGYTVSAYVNGSAVVPAEVSIEHERGMPTWTTL